MPDRWCTVTVTDAQGRRHSVDILASSTFDAAHLYLAHARGNPGSGIPVLGKNTVFEVVSERKVYTVTGAELQKWIDQRRQTLKGPRGMLFCRRPRLD